MKLEPIAKPVRIRITSNGKEHTDLDSLRENFCIDDVFKSYTEKGLVKWLRQIKEDDLASYIKDIGTRVKDEFERKILLCYLLFYPPKNDEEFGQLCSHVDEEQMCGLLLRINANDDLHYYIKWYVDLEVLKKLMKSNEFGCLDLGKECLRALNVSEFFIKEIKEVKYIGFFEYLKKCEKLEKVEKIELDSYALNTNGFIKESAYYMECTLYTIEEIKMAHDFKYTKSALYLFKPKSSLLNDITKSGIHLLSLLTVPVYTDEFKFTTTNRYVSEAFLVKHKETIENGKINRDNICEILWDLAYYSVFTK